MTSHAHDGRSTAEWQARRKFNDALTDGEMAVVECFAYGFQIPQIAEAFCLSPWTIKDREQSARIKLGVHTRPALVAEAIWGGYVR